MATVFVLRRMPDGALALAAFLIDTWCMGLKDAWGRLDMAMKEFQQIRADRPGIQFDSERELVAATGGADEED